MQRIKRLMRAMPEQDSSQDSREHQCSERNDPHGNHAMALGRAEERKKAPGGLDRVISREIKRLLAEDPDSMKSDCGKE